MDALVLQFGNHLGARGGNGLPLTGTPDKRSPAPRQETVTPQQTGKRAAPGSGGGAAKRVALADKGKKGKKGQKDGIPEFTARQQGDDIPEFFLQAGFKAHLAVARNLKVGTTRLAEDARVGAALLGSKGQAQWKGQDLWGNGWHKTAHFHAQLVQRTAKHMQQGLAVLDFTPANPVCIALSHIDEDSKRPGLFRVQSPSPFAGLVYQLSK
jgi:hypothetical protein